jgi:hypothetical protein
VVAECDRSAGEQDERECGLGGVKAVGASRDEPNPVVERLGAGVGHPVANGGEDAVMLLADRSGEPHERRESAARSSRAEALKQFVDIIDAETRREDASERYL